MKKGLINLIIFVIMAFFIAYFFDDIANYVKSLLDNQPKVVVPAANEYYKKASYDYVKESKDYVPYSKQDLYNIFYSILDNGFNNFTFYCPDEYTKCISDVASLTKEPDTLTHINNYVSPFNNFSSINVVYSTSGEVDVEVTKLYTNQEIVDINKKMDEIEKQVITDKMTIQDKILAIHDYIINNTKYDQDREKGTSTHNSNIAYGPLIEGYAVCGGYADSMALFLNRFGVKNYKVASLTHVWNAVYINHEWLHVDLTWDDPVTINSTKDTLLHKFFLINTSKLKSYNISDHEFDQTIYQELAEKNT